MGIGEVCGQRHRISAPFYVRFSEGITIDEEIIDVVQPDISVVRNPSKIDERGCLGTPDFIIEILSPAIE